MKTIITEVFHFKGHFFSLSHGLDDTYSAAASIATRVSRALVDLDLAACTSVSRQTRASIAPLASVGTGGAILTGLVVGTVVQI